MRSFLSKVRQHWRTGTLLDALQLRSPLTPDTSRVMWHGRQTPSQAARVLAHRARSLLADQPDNHWILSLGDGDAFHAQLNRWLAFDNVPFRTHRLEEFDDGSATSSKGVAGILAAYPDARRRARAARFLASHPVLAGVPFEYPFGLNPEADVFERLDEYPDTFFVSPVLLDDPSPYAIYQESLRHFRQKCGLRDYLDLYQLIKFVLDNRIPGDIAEFGSYQGHSGWLIARTLQALASDKRLFLFDTFEEFPEELLGIDRFWNRSHRVTFDDVRAKLQCFERVHLIKGDFTQTLKTSELTTIALAYVDCDSFRATRFLLDAVIPEQLSPRGILVCEDYGHPALLGARAAVHEGLDGKNGLFRFFSQFSGLYVVLKL